jgi:hypothetical protein
MYSEVTEVVGCCGLCACFLAFAERLEFIKIRLLRLLFCGHQTSKSAGLFTLTEGVEPAQPGYMMRTYLCR